MPAHLGGRILANAPTAGWLGFEFRLLLSAKRRWREWDCRWLSESGSALLDALSLRDALAERVGLTSHCSVLPLSLRSFGSNHLVGRGFKSHPHLALCAGGEGGIRTHGWFPIFGFQDRRDRPLCHLSWLLRTRGYLRWRCGVAKWKFDWCGCLIVGGFGIPMGDACFDCGG